MSILASAILAEVGVELADTANTRWPPDDLIDYINDAQRAITVLRPDATQITKAVQLAAGTQQDIPSDGYKFLRLFENLGASGKSAPVSGRQPQYRDLGALDRHSPRWRGATAGDEVREYTVDTLTRKRYHVSPPVHPTTQVWVKLQYSRFPTNIPRSTDSPAYAAALDYLDVSDIYHPALLEYVLMRCHRKSNEAADKAKVQQHGQAFMGMMGVKGRSDVLYSVDMRDHPYDDNPARPEAVSN